MRSSHSGTRRLKKVLLSMIVVGLLGSVTVHRTYALLSGEEQNPASKVSSGTLTLNNTVNGATATTCFSDAGPASPGNVVTTCDALFTSASVYAPGASTTSTVKIKDDGSLDASDLSVYMPSCTKVATPSATVNGGGDPCGASGAQFYLQETDLNGNATTCWFPSGSTTCSFVSNALYVFSQQSSSASALDLGKGPAAQGTRYFTIGIKLPSNALNTLQGEAAAFPLTWHMTS